jgi:PIN domain nuclease of toxin-antitoxin system
VNVAPLLDTHAWIWWVDHDPRLGLPCLDSLDGLPEDARPAISDISLWEVATLLERGWVRFEIPFEE